MPLPQGPDARTYPLVDASAASGSVLRGKPEDKVRTATGEDSFFDVSMEDLSLPGEGAAAARNDGEAVCTDRAELIERLKRGESPQWIPNQSVSSKSINIGMPTLRKLCYLFCHWSRRSCHNLMWNTSLYDDMPMLTILPLSQICRHLFSLDI